jgi:hypothetical protein
MNGKTLILAIAAAAMAAPAALAGPPVSEKTAGLFPPTPISKPLVSEKLAGLFEAPQAAPLVSEKTAGLWQSPVSAAPVFAAPGGGFDWADAGVGAGIAMASLLAASAGAVAIRRRGTLAH